MVVIEGRNGVCPPCSMLHDIAINASSLRLLRCTCAFAANLAHTAGFFTPLAEFPVKFQAFMHVGISATITNVECRRAERIALQCLSVPSSRAAVEISPRVPSGCGKASHGLGHQSSASGHNGNSRRNWEGE